MADKSIGVYNLPESNSEQNNQLVLEISSSYISAITVNKNGRIHDFELFNCTAAEHSNIADLLTAVIARSKILPLNFTDVKVICNHPKSLLVPSDKFTKELASKYFSIVYGPDPFATFYYNHLTLPNDLMNVFTVSKAISTAVSERFDNVTYQHAYSGLIQNSYVLSRLRPQLLVVQFFNNFFTATLFIDNKLQLVQSFSYQTPEDVSYHLLNLVRQLNLFTNEVSVEISGLIDLEFTVYREVVKYFTNVSVQNIHEEFMVEGMNQFPLHYFTPFINFAL